MKNRKGISLITLVITIIVVIILAAAIILTLQNSNIFGNANKAKVLNDIATFKEELELYKQNQYVQTSGKFQPNTLQANIDVLSQNGTIVNDKNIYDVIPALENINYIQKGDFAVVDGKLVYRGTNSDIQDWAQDAGVIVDKGNVNIALTTTQTIPVQKGTAIKYNLRMFSGVGINDITKEEIQNGLKVVDGNNAELATQPALTLSDISGTANDKSVEITIDTSGLVDGEYGLKLAANVVKNGEDKFNDEYISSQTFAIDSTAPVLTTDDISTNPKTWTKESVELTIAIPSEADKVEYSFDNQDWTEYTNPVTITSNGAVYIKATDKSGNTSYLTYNITIIDMTIPNDSVVSNIDSASSSGKDLSFTVTLQDANSGINVTASKYVVSTSSVAYAEDDNVWSDASPFTSNPQNISVTLPDSGNYYIQILSVDNADNKIVTVSSLINVYVEANRPNIEGLPSATTVAVKWDLNNNESHIDLATSQTDTSWYDYSSKRWANILTSNNGNYAYWVWIPRYAYKIDHPHTATAEQIHIIFLNGTSNNPVDGSTLPSDYIVHPAFTFGGIELSGIWVAKYEASSSDPNRVDGTGTYQGYTGGGNDSTLQVRILPNVYSWRNISMKNVQTVSMNMKLSQGSVGTINVDTHLIKNIEWGAVAYLTQSQYGQEPWINPYGDTTPGTYKLKTGYSGESKDSYALIEGSSELHPYNDLTYGVKASTTNNIYGIYDMSGGGLEITASLIDNGSYNIGINAGDYAINNKIKPEYLKYYDIYEPGNEEKEGAYFYGAEGEKLFNSDAPYNINEVNNNVIRKRLTDATYLNFASKKGDALYETSVAVSYYGKLTDETGTSTWLIDTVRTTSEGMQACVGWNSDTSVMGYASRPWIYRGVRIL